MHAPKQCVLAQEELSKHNCKKCRLDIWQRGVDTDMFNPRFRSAEMRERLTDGHPDAPLLIHVGRLGAEKNLFVLKDILQKIPEARLAFVGDGPSRAQLQEHFADMPNVKFMVCPEWSGCACVWARRRGLPQTASSLRLQGMMKGEELSQAYASGDVFVMPSESETLGFVVLEAMASRVPVVAVAAGGLTDIITRPGENGA
jgi:sulfoquinovosyltransferase